MSNAPHASLRDTLRDKLKHRWPNTPWTVHKETPLRVEWRLGPDMLAVRVWLEDQGIDRKAVELRRL